MFCAQQAQYAILGRREHSVPRHHIGGSGDVHANRSAGVQGHLCAQRRKECPDRSAARSNVIPVETDRKHPEPFIPGSTTYCNRPRQPGIRLGDSGIHTENAGEPCAALVRKAEDADSCKSTTEKRTSP